MNIVFSPSFVRDLKKIKDRSVLASIRRTILSVEQAADPSAIDDLSKFDTHALLWWLDGDTQ